jgi:hypothetical protein
MDFTHLIINYCYKLHVAYPVVNKKTAKPQYPTWMDKEDIKDLMKINGTAPDIFVVASDMANACKAVEPLRVLSVAMVGRGIGDCDTRNRVDNIYKVGKSQYEGSVPDAIRPEHRWHLTGHDQLFVIAENVDEALRVLRPIEPSSLSWEGCGIIKRYDEGKAVD